MTSKELKALVSLLDDPDSEVFGVVSNRIIVQGLKIISQLERSWEESTSELTQSRLENIIHTIQFQSTKAKLTQWVESGATDLLEGAIHVASYQFPELDYQSIDSAINELKKTVWQELNQSLTPLEKVKAVNHIFFGINQFSANTTDFFSPDNHLVNKVLESKKGGPVCLAVLYSTLAQKLGLPVYCVSLPRNFILAFLNRYRSVQEEHQSESRVLFYISLFNGGRIVGHSEVEKYLENQKVEPKLEYFEPCSNRSTISQLIASLMLAYQKIDQPQKVSDLQEFLSITAEKFEV